MCRRVPGAYMCVNEASKAMLKSLDFLRRQDAAPVNARAHRHECVSPAGVERKERIPGGVPFPDRLHPVYGGVASDAAIAGRNSLGLLEQDRRAGLQEWIAVAVSR